MGALLLAFGLGVQAVLPQQPDGDGTAVAQFVGQYGEGARHRLREAFWINLAGALLAWGALVRLGLVLVRGGRRWWIGALGWLGVLVVLAGWGWDRSAGWQAELFMAMGDPRPLGPLGEPVVTFAGFRILPAPDGPGRALALTLFVDGVAHDVAEAAPYRRAGWTIRPRWYGGTVTTASLGEPLYWGESGSREVRLVDGTVVRLFIDVETLTGRAEPPLRDDIVHVAHHAIVRATYAPGGIVRWMGGVLVAGALLLWLASRRYNPGSG